MQHQNNSTSLNDKVQSGQSQTNNVEEIKVDQHLEEHKISEDYLNQQNPYTQSSPYLQTTNPLTKDIQQQQIISQQHSQKQKSSGKSWLGRLKSKLGGGSNSSKSGSSQKRQEESNHNSSDQNHSSSGSQHDHNQLTLQKGMLSRISGIGKGIWDTYHNYHQIEEHKQGDVILQHNYYLDTEEDIDNLNVKDFMKITKDKQIITEAYYFTKLTQVKGNLTLNHQYIQFDPIQSEENTIEPDMLSSFQTFVDYQDIINIDLLKIINEKVLSIDNEFVQSAYQYEYLIQFNMSSLNGMTLRSSKDFFHQSGLRKSLQPVANIFIKFSHRNKDGQLLTNQSQQIIVDHIYKEIINKMRSAQFTTYSQSYIPYFDMILDENDRQNLMEIPMSQIVNDKVKSVNFQKLLNKNAPGIQLIKFIPNKSEKSEFLTDQQISNIIEELPSMLKQNNWTLVYSMNRDGVSLNTFYEKAKKWKHTLLFIQDTNNYVFGGYCTENWRVSSKFYGTGENFLFTFRNCNQPIAYRWSGQDDQLQWGSETFLGLGGGTLGRFGIFLQDSFLKGSSSKTTTFDNEILSENYDFICTNLELWGLE
eukprot:403332297